MNCRELIALIIADGWYLHKQKGSHRQYKHPTKTGKVTIACHGQGDDIPNGTLNSVLKQAGVTRRIK